MSNQVSLTQIVSALAKERRIEQGRDTETNLASELGRQPTRDETLARMRAELDQMFGRADG